MDNNQKILIAAIIIILIILVGAFALSGSNNATPTVTPTATPVTVTPTPVPSGGSAGASTPTPSAVAVTPTPTPSVTATPEPESGVKLTEFGYWITYPPLGPENWSTNVPPSVNSGPENNTVYFGPTSADVNVPYEVYIGTADERGTPAVIHRNGDLNGTTTVGVYVIPDDNMVFSDSLVGSYYIPTQPYMTWIGSDHSYFNVTFGPGVSEQTVYIDAWEVYQHYTDPLSVDAASDFHGSVKLDIVEADDGYKVGNDHEFTLNVNSAPPVSTGDVQFIADGGYLWNGLSQSNELVNKYSDGSNMDVDYISYATWEVNITLTRSNTVGSLSPDVTISSTNVPGDISISQQPTFDDGQADATLQVIYTHNSAAGPYADFTIGTSPLYTVGTNGNFNLGLNVQW